MSSSTFETRVAAFVKMVETGELDTKVVFPEIANPTIVEPMRSVDTAELFAKAPVFAFDKPEIGLLKPAYRLDQPGRYMLEFSTDEGHFLLVLEGGKDKTSKYAAEEGYNANQLASLDYSLFWKPFLKGVVHEKDGIHVHIYTCAHLDPEKGCLTDMLCKNPCEGTRINLDILLPPVVNIVPL